MKPLLAAAGMLLSTLSLLAMLFWMEPFAGANLLLGRAFGAAPQWTQVTWLWRDPQTQESSHGERPLPSLEALAAYWRQHPGLERSYFFGNSQMLAVSLAPGEPPPAAPEKTYFDLVADHYLHRGDGPALCYRLAAPGMSYTETLWYLYYVFSRPELKPQRVVLQINYQSFWNGGVRGGLLPMLDAPLFRQAIQEAAGEGRPYSEVFQEALHAYREQGAAERSPRSGLAGAPGFGEALELAVRRRLAGVPGFNRRGQQKDEFLALLYAGRTYFLHLKPSTARSITGARLLCSQASIEAIARLCGRHGVRLVLFHAPINPRLSLYRTPEDRSTYRQFVQRVAERHCLPLFDFETAVPGPYWGRLLNGPDPMHLGRAGHAMLARMMVEALDASAASKPLCH